MPNTRAQEINAIAEYRSLPITETLKKAALIQQIGKLAFSQDVFDFLKEEAYFDGIVYLDNLDATSRAAFEVLENNWHLSVVRSWFAEMATKDFLGNRKMALLYPGGLYKRDYLGDRCADIIWKRSLNAALAACE